MTYRMAFANLSSSFFFYLEGYNHIRKSSNKLSYSMWWVKMIFFFSNVFSFFQSFIQRFIIFLFLFIFFFNHNQYQFRFKYTCLFLFRSLVTVFTISLSFAAMTTTVAFRVGTQCRERSTKKKKKWEENMKEMVSDIGNGDLV